MRLSTMANDGFNIHSDLSSKVDCPLFIHLLKARELQTPDLAMTSRVAPHPTQTPISLPCYARYTT